MSDTKQPFRAGDTVLVKSGPCANQRWGVAVYDASTDNAWIAGWPCTMIANASEALELYEACTDAEHEAMVEAISKMRGDHGEGDPRRSALESVLATGGVP